MTTLNQFECEQIVSPEEAEKIIGASHSLSQAGSLASPGMVRDSSLTKRFFSSDSFTGNYVGTYLVEDSHYLSSSGDFSITLRDKYGTWIVSENIQDFRNDTMKHFARHTVSDMRTFSAGVHIRTFKDSYIGRMDTDDEDAILTARAEVISGMLDVIGRIIGRAKPIIDHYDLGHVIFNRRKIMLPNGTGIEQWRDGVESQFRGFYVPLNCPMSISRDERQIDVGVGQVYVYSKGDWRSITTDTTDMVGTEEVSLLFHNNKI